MWIKMHFQIKNGFSTCSSKLHKKVSRRNLSWAYFSVISKKSIFVMIIFQSLEP